MGNAAAEVKGPRVLVTGATGNVGAPLVEHLVAGGAEVLVASRDGARALAGTKAVRFDFEDPSTHAPALEGVEKAHFHAPVHPGPQGLLDVTRARLTAAAAAGK